MGPVIAMEHSNTFTSCCFQAPELGNATVWVNVWSACNKLGEQRCVKFAQLRKLDGPESTEVLMWSRTWMLDAIVVVSKAGIVGIAPAQSLHH